MTNVGRIITRFRTQMEVAGLVKPTVAAQLSPQLRTMRPSLTQARLALQERQLVVQASPMATLFEVTLENRDFQALLVDLGEERAERIIGQLCGHGQRMIKEHGIDGAEAHLTKLFEDLPDYEAKLREEKGLEEIIQLYQEAGRNEAYLRLKLGDKIAELVVDDKGMISLKMASSTNESDLICLWRVRNLQKLYLWNTQVSDITPLSSLTSLQSLNLGETQVSDLTPLSGLTSLRVLNLWITQVSDLTPLSDLTNLKELYLGGTQVRDVAPLRNLTSLQKLDLGGTPVGDIGPLSGLINLQELDLDRTQVSDVTLLSGLTSLQELNLWRTQVSNTQVEELKRAIPGLVVNK